MTMAVRPAPPGTPGFESPPSGEASESA
jgi:hypothetical protein